MPFRPSSASSPVRMHTSALRRPRDLVCFGWVRDVTDYVPQWHEDLWLYRRLKTYRNLLILQTQEVNQE